LPHHERANSLDIVVAEDLRKRNHASILQRAFYHYVSPRRGIAGKCRMPEIRQHATRYRSNTMADRANPGVVGGTGLHLKLAAKIVRWRWRCQYFGQRW
jgi:hypothetical protein